MISFLLALAPFSGAILQIAGWLISMFGTSKANLEAYQEMVQKNKDSGLITVETYERLSKYHAEGLADYEQKNNPPKAQG